MEAFDYAALNASGTRETGTLMAASAREARDMLRARALMPVDLSPSRKKAKTERASFSGRRIKHKEVTLATRQLAILIDAATPVEDALRVTALQFEKSAMRDVLLSVRAQVMEGLRLSDALRSQPQAFDPLYIAMVASGETSGKLAAVLERLADDLESAQAIRRKVMGATAYPIVLSIVALAVVIILMVLVVPKVVTQFETFGQDLPPLTKITIAVSAWLKAYGVFAAIALFVLGTAARFSLRLPDVRRRWDGFKLRLPVLGRLTRDLNAARFSRTMAGLIAAGTPALAAMETAQHTLRNTVMREAVAGAIISVREGAPISAALRQTKVFPPLVVQMVVGGEASGDVATLFSKAADYLESEFEAATQIFLSLLEPAIIIFLAGIVLLIVAAIFLPILQLNTLAY